ncbi:MAG TPA: FmdE family protein [Armatimonadota bacterium]|nr:FmdE family protein [Armatimonadota bacterium]
MSRQPEKARDWEQAVRFHGHTCPGLAIGYRAAKIALERLGAKRSEDEELIAIAETDSCAVDAVQWLSGCTFGKGNLFFRDYGKHVFTFALRPSGRAVRVALRLGQSEEPVGHPENETELILNAPAEALFDIREMTIDLPPAAQIRDSLACDACGELVMVGRTVSDRGRTLCIPCSQEQSR